MWRQLKKKTNKVEYKSEHMILAMKQAEEKKKAQALKESEQAENRKRRMESRAPSTRGDQSTSQLNEADNPRETLNLNQIAVNDGREGMEAGIGVLDKNVGDGVKDR